MNRHKLTNEELRHLGIAMVIGRKIDGIIVRNGAITDGRGRGIMYAKLSRSEYLQIKQQGVRAQPGVERCVLDGRLYYRRLFAPT